MSASNNPTTRNHYLPQFYLRSFADPAGMVLQTKRRPGGEELFERRFVPRSTGYQTDLYSISPVFENDVPLVTDKIEKEFFGPIDNKAAPAMKGLIDRGPSSLSDDEKRNWALFLNSLLERIPSVLEAQDAKADKIGREWLENFLRKYSDYPESLARWADTLAKFRPEAASRNAVRYAMCTKIEEQPVIDYFLKCNWLVVKVVDGPQEAQFATSNVPVVVNAGSNGAIEALTLALSCEHLFVLYRSSELTCENIATLSQVHNFGLFPQSTHVYSRFSLCDGDYMRSRTAAEAMLNKPSD